MNWSPRGLTLWAALVAGASASVLALVTAPAVAETHVATYQYRIAKTYHYKIAHPCDTNQKPGHARCMVEVAEGVQPSADGGPGAGYGPADLHDAYNLSSDGGAGQRVYIIDAYDNPNAEKDLAEYRANYGLPACTTANRCFQKLNQDGAANPLPSADPDPRSTWSTEISLDLDMVSAICPKCGITLIEADSNGYDMFKAVKTATDLGAKFVSMSWAANESGNEGYLDSNYLNADGVVYAASTGDHGYAAGVAYPASSPNAVAVGGTSLEKSDNARGWTESAWGTDPNFGAGSGCSGDEAKPTWQGVIPNNVCANRAIADVSAVGDPNTGVAVYDQGKWILAGGTSASAPIIAAT